MLIEIFMKILLGRSLERIKVKTNKATPLGVAR